MRLPSRAPVIVLALFLLPRLAHAEWLPGGNRIGAGSGLYREFVGAQSGPGRVVVASIHYAGGDRFEVRARAWMSDGAPVPGWPEESVLVSDVAGRNQSLAVTEDGSGGAYIGWTNSMGSEANAWLQHVTGSGSIASGWAPEGIHLGASDSEPPALALDGAGGVLVGWGYYDAGRTPHMVVQHLDAAGTPSPDWPAGGLALSNEVALGLLMDAGWVFLSTVHYDPLAHTSAGVIVRRLDLNGLPDPSWPQAGTLLTDGRYSSGTILFPDGGGGVFTGWSQNIVGCGDCYEPIPNQVTYRVLSDGSADDRWAPVQRAFSTAPDQAGGMLLAAIADGRPGAVRLDAAGAPMPGWSAVGNPATTVRVDPFQVVVTGDGRGGAFLAWVDGRTGTGRLYASRLDASGVRTSEWPATGSLVSGGSLTRYGIQMIPLAPDVAIAVWEEQDPANSTYAGYLTALRPGLAGPVPPPRGNFSILRTGPNPAIGAIDVTVEVREQGPARLELVDAAGRVRESRDDIYFAPIYCGICGEMIARTTLRFNEGGTLPAGMYWLRLTQAGNVATQKIAVLR